MDAAHSPIALLLAGNILFKRKKINYCSRTIKEKYLVSLYKRRSNVYV